MMLRFLFFRLKFKTTEQRNFGGEMIHSKWLRYLIFTGIAMLAVASCSAQQKFPLRPGEWSATINDPSMPPMTILYCLNDELWTKSLTQNSSCTISLLTVTSSGISYNMSCKMPSAQITGKVQMDFDGMQHMISKATINLTMNGKTTQSTNQSDYRWKSATCSPADKNLSKSATKP